MKANDTNKKIIYAELSYQLTGLFFKIHNELGRYCREKQYADAVEHVLQTERINFLREVPLPLEAVPNQFTNRVDFDIESKILVEIKAKSVITKDDYYQMLRYLDAARYKLGMIVNFRNKYLKPIRVIRGNS